MVTNVAADISDCELSLHYQLNKLAGNRFLAILVSVDDAAVSVVDEDRAISPFCHSSRQPTPVVIIAGKCE